MGWGAGERDRQTDIDREAGLIKTLIKLYCVVKQICLERERERGRLY